MTDEGYLCLTLDIARKARVDVCRVVYGFSEHDLGKLIGPHPENLTMGLPCRAVLGAGQRAIQVVGPLLEDESRAVHEGFWR